MPQELVSQRRDKKNYLCQPFTHLLPPRVSDIVRLEAALWGRFYAPYGSGSTAELTLIAL